MNTFQQIERISLEIDMKCRELAIFMNSNEFNSINELCKKRYDELISKQKEFFNLKKKFEREEVSQLISNVDSDIIDCKLTCTTGEFRYQLYDYYKSFEIDDIIREGFEADNEILVLFNIRDKYREISMGDEILEDEALNLYKKINIRNDHIRTLDNQLGEKQIIWNYSDDFNHIKVGILND